MEPIAIMIAQIQVKQDRKIWKENDSLAILSDIQESHDICDVKSSLRWGKIKKGTLQRQKSEKDAGL